MTRSSYRSTSARSIAFHKALGLWNRHAGGESITCWTQQVRLPGVRLAWLQFDVIASKKLICCRYAGLWYLVNEGLSIRDKVQIVETDLGSKAWVNIFCQESWKHVAWRKWRRAVWKIRSEGKWPEDLGLDRKINSKRNPHYIW